MKIRSLAILIFLGSVPAWADLGSHVDKLGVGAATITLMAVVAPLLAELLRRFKVPMVVLEILLGMVIGPHCLALVKMNSVNASLSLLGLCFLFFMAGLEIDFFQIKGRPLGQAFKGWAMSLAIAIVACGLLHFMGVVKSTLLVAVALSTTAIGTLLPILKESGELETDFGTLLLGIGAAGEFGPIALISLLASHEASGPLQAIVLLGFGAWLVLAAWLAHRVRPVGAIEFLQKRCTALRNFLSGCASS